MGQHMKDIRVKYLINIVLFQQFLILYGCFSKSVLTYIDEISTVGC